MTNLSPKVRVREFAMPSEDWMSVSVLRPEVCRTKPTAADAGQKKIKHRMIHFEIGSSKKGRFNIPEISRNGKKVSVGSCLRLQITFQTLNHSFSVTQPLELVENACRALDREPNDFVCQFPISGVFLVVIFHTCNYHLLFSVSKDI